MRQKLPSGAKGAIVRPGSQVARALKCGACPQPPDPMPKPSAATASPDPVTPANYEVALHELEALIARMDAGELPLDELLVSYQRGAVLLQFCRDKLQAVEDQVKVLEDGVLKPWKTV